MRQVICRVFELISEDAAAGSVGVVRVLLGSTTGEIDELFLVDDTGGLHAFDDCAKLEQEVGLLDSNIIWHTTVNGLDCASSNDAFTTINARTCELYSLWPCRQRPMRCR